MSENMFGSQKHGDARSTQIQKHLKQCTPDELQDELDALILSTDGSEADIELIDAYLAELDKRVPLEQEITAADSLKSFHEKHGMLFEEVPQKPVKQLRRPKRYLVLIAAVIAVAGILTMQAAGTTLFGSLARWSDETFGISFGYQADAMERNPEYLPLQRAVEEAGITVPLVPKYLPEGYVQKEFHVYNDGTVLFSGYIAEDNEFGIQIQSSTLHKRSETQKVDEFPEIIIAGGIEHFVVINNHSYIAVWENGGFTCTITGVTDKIELHKMIESIYMEELS